MNKRVVSCAPDVLDKVRDAVERSGEDIDVEVDETFKKGELLMAYRGKSVVDTGYVYAPYVPLQVTPTIFPEGEKPKKTPLQELAEEIFKEEIEAGEIKPIWDNEPEPAPPAPEHLQTGVLNRHWKVYKDPRISKIRPEFFKKASITNL